MTKNKIYIKENKGYNMDEIDKVISIKVDFADPNTMMRIGYISSDDITLSESYTNLSLKIDDTKFSGYGKQEIKSDMEGDWYLFKNGDEYSFYRDDDNDDDNDDDDDDDLIGELKTKIEVYENVLHDINMFSSIVMSGDVMDKLISMINSWSYAHRQGNGMIDNNKLVEEWFMKLQNGDYKK